MSYSSQALIYVGVTEVTQEQFLHVMEGDRSRSLQRTRTRSRREIRQTTPPQT